MTVIRQTADQLKVLGKDRVVVHGLFRPNGASGIVASSQKGFGWSVSRTSVGLYTLQMQGRWPALISASAMVRSADGAHVAAVMGDYDSTNGTMQMRVRNGPAHQIWLPLSGARAVPSNDYRVVADGANLGSGGVLASDSKPALTRVNGATDIAAHLIWVANGVEEIQWDGIPVPDVCNTANAATVNLWLEKDTNTDTTAVVAVKAFVGKGDSNAGGNTAALAAATLAKKTVVVAAADVGAGPGFCNIAVVPGAHANDAIRLYAASVSFETLCDLAADVDNEISFELIFRNSDSNY